MPRPTPLLTRVAAVLALALTASVGVVPAQSAAAVTTSVVDPNNVKVANFEGWGTALSWGANVVGGWSSANRTAIADALFSPTSGLGLNVVRYQIGGGQNPNWQSVGCGAQRAGSPLPTFEPSQGVWDWTADANQRWFAQRAQADGANKFLGFGSSPPWWMTVSGCSNGGATGGNNLQGWWGYNGAGGTSYSHGTNDSVTFTFSGTGIQFYGAKSSDSGKDAFSVDGGAETVVDLYSSTRVDNVLLYTSPTVASGTHTLKIRVTGTKNAAATDYYVSADHVTITPSGTSVSNQVRGTGLNQFNYHWGYYEAYADYLSEVAKHYRDSWGITFNYIDPLNEPEGAWLMSGNQEGAFFDAGGQDEVVNRLGQSLAAKGLTGTSVAASDGFGEAATSTSWGNFSSSAKGYVSAITTHTYGNNTADANTLNATAAANGKKLWVGEYGTGEVQWGPGQYADPTQVQPAVNIAARIVGDMTDLRPSAWILWDGIESWEANIQENISWGAIWAKYLDPNQTWTLAKQYYGYENFTKYIRPGSRFISSGDPTAVAAYDPNSNQLTIVKYNDSTSSASTTYDLSRFTGPITSATPYRTSGSESMAQLSPISITGNQLNVTAAPKSITTYVMTNVKATVNDNTTGTGINQFSYNTPWGYYASQPGAYNLDNHWSGTTGDDYQVQFTGSQVKVYAAVAPNQGIAAFSVDGGAETNVDLYASSRTDQVLQWTSPSLTPGTHTLKVRVTGSKNPASSYYYVPADRVDVIP
jgi:O-glycosyl hydrolase